MSATIISAAVFAGFHAALDPSLWQTAEGVLTTTLLFLLGLGLARLAIHFKRLGPSIFVHSGFNLTTAGVALFLPRLGLTSTDRNRWLSVEADSGPNSSHRLLCSGPGIERSHGHDPLDLWVLKSFVDLP